MKSPEEIKTKFMRDQEIGDSERVEMTKGARGVMIGYLNKYLGSDENRHIVLAWLMNAKTREISSHSLRGGDWYALSLWIDSRNIGEGMWVTQPDFPMEAASVLSVALGDLPERGAQEDDDRNDDDGALRPFRAFVG